MLMTYFASLTHFVPQLHCGLTAARRFSQWWLTATVIKERVPDPSRPLSPFFLRMCVCVFPAIVMPTLGTATSLLDPRSVFPSVFLKRVSQLLLAVGFLFFFFFKQNSVQSQANRQDQDDSRARRSLHVGYIREPVKPFAAKRDEKKKNSDVACS